MTSNILKENLLIGIGHPLLDITSKVDKSFLKKYNLKDNDTVIANDNHQNIYEDLLKNYKVTYTVGGSIQNTLRIIQWLIEVPNVTTFFGAVSKDESSKILLSKALNDGVNVKYQYVEKDRTGTCIVLITDVNRSLCTYPGSSKLFSMEYLLSPSNKILLDGAKYYYMGGFFLNVSIEAVFYVAKLAAVEERQFLFNIGAPFICECYKESLLKLMPYVDVIFGNRMEIEALAEAFQITTKNIDEILLILTNWEKITTKKTRLVILTQGEDPILIGRNNKVLKYNVQQIEAEKIVDTNGAGDAFVGGFLAQYIQEQNLDKCVNCGIWAATQIIQTIGCRYEGKAAFFSK